MDAARVVVLTHHPEALPSWLRAGPGLSIRLASTLSEAAGLLESLHPQAVIVDRAFLGDRARVLKLLGAAEDAPVLFLGAREHRADTPPGAVLEGMLGRGRGAFRLTRVPIKRGDEIVLLPVRDVASLEADGELVHLTTVRGERHTVSRALKALEARLDPAAFVRLSRGVLVSVGAIARLRVLPRGGLSAVLVNQAEFPISRSQSVQVRRRLVDL
jgi:DNA-binding LytR/AlgR family response regulator